jgi:N-acylneuraminate cytidylyltransferase/CMP-N,N'-diacetyllegionaminic acid synthase
VDTNTKAMRRICTICARGGSKGVENKNLRLVRGVPLIAHTIAHALAAGVFDEIAVSSDSRAILDEAARRGVKHLVERPAELATDTAAKVPAIRHCVRTIEERLGVRFDTCCDLDATSPLRRGTDVANSVRLLEEKGVGNLFSVVPARRSPYFNLVELDEQGTARLSKRLTKPIVRRQDAPQCFDMNASIYVWRRDALESGDTVFLDDTAVYVMDHRSAFDIDSEGDLQIVELLMADFLDATP